jgi:translation initiation factor IF-2
VPAATPRRSTASSRRRRPASGSGADAAARAGDGRRARADAPPRLGRCGPGALPARWRRGRRRPALLPPPRPRGGGRPGRAARGGGAWRGLRAPGPRGGRRQGRRQGGRRAGPGHGVPGARGARPARPGREPAGPGAADRDRASGEPVRPPGREPGGRARDDAADAGHGQGGIGAARPALLEDPPRAGRRVQRPPGQHLHQGPARQVRRGGGPGARRLQRRPRPGVGVATRERGPARRLRGAAGRLDRDDPVRRDQELRPAGIEAREVYKVLLGREKAPAREAAAAADATPATAAVRPAS